MDELVAIGATATDSVHRLAANSEVIISCLTNDKAVLEVYTRARGALSAAEPGSIVIEMSTVSPATSRKLFELGVKGT